MALFEGKTPAERNKTILALLLPAIALVLLLRMFFFTGSPAPRPANSNQRGTKGGVNRTQPGPNSAATDVPPDGEQIVMPTEVNCCPAPASAPDAARNIFAYYVPPTPKPTLEPTATPTPTPTPPPPIALGAVQPASVYARTDGFTLELSGDKFTPQTFVYMDGQQLQTTFKSAQQLSAQVPAALIQSPGTRAVVVRTADNALYSNNSTVNVMPPPTPQYTYIGLYGRKGYVNKAILKPTAGNDLLTVQLGDVVGGRFKVTSISERAVDFTDTQLKIKHTIPYTDAKSVAGAPTSRFPQPPAADDDDEP